MENSEELIEKMKSMNVKPKPTWHFTFKTTFYWFIFFISVALGAFAFSIVLFAIQQIDFDLVSHMSHSKLEFLLGLAPFFWIISIIIFLFAAMIGVKKSKKGYKFSYAKILAFSASFSILIGTLFFIGGGAEWLENAFSVRVGLYESVDAKKAKMWSEPEKGFLAGTIIEAGNTILQLTDLNGNFWTVDIEQANIPRSVLITDGEKIKIIGEITSTSNFRAAELRPWGGNGGGQRWQKRKGQNNE